MKLIKITLSSFLCYLVYRLSLMAYLPLLSYISDNSWLILVIVANIIIVKLLFLFIMPLALLPALSIKWFRYNMLWIAFLLPTLDCIVLIVLSYMNYYNDGMPGRILLANVANPVIVIYYMIKSSIILRHVNV